MRLHAYLFAAVVGAAAPPLEELAAPAASPRCAQTKVGCPLCYDIIEHWNAEGKAPAPDGLAAYCTDVVAERWRASYETLTGKAFVELRERTRCVAVAAGLHEMVRQGCALPTCTPSVACATFC